jgi:hypothetical protein
LTAGRDSIVGALYHVLTEKAKVRAFRQSPAAAEVNE